MHGHFEPFIVQKFRQSVFFALQRCKALAPICADTLQACKAPEQGCLSALQTCKASEQG